MSLKNMRTRSTAPPMYPESNPIVIEMIRDSTATMTPNASVLRIAKVACQKRSCPREFVPNQ